MNLAPIVGSPLRNLVSLLIQYRPSRKYYAKVLFVLLVSAAGWIFRLYENILVRKKINKVSLQKDPIFIIGHWRGGTTHLHNLLCLDEQFGYVSTLHTLFPQAYLKTSVFAWFLKLFMPKTRPMDNVKLSTQAPQEEELALCAESPYSFYTGWLFPRNLMEIVERYVTFDKTTQANISKWKKAYHRILQRATYEHGGKQLILKNPANTSRVKELLECYPNAKFIHIHRNPYEVFLSTHQLYKTATPVFQLQEINKEKLEESFISIYKKLYTKYLADKPLIPKGQLVSIKYDDLQATPFDKLSEIYDTLGLEGFSSLQPKLENYLKGIKNYKKNSYELDEAAKMTVKEEWGFVFDVFGYTKSEATV